MKSYRVMSEIQLNKMTNAQLKDYIRDMGQRVVSHLRSKNGNIRKSASDIVNELGTYRRNRKTFLRLGLGRARKSDLISKAQTLQGFSKAYLDETFSLDEQHKKAYESFKKNKKYGKLFKGITELEYDQLVRAVDSVQDIIEDFGSEVFRIYHDYVYKKKSYKVLGTIFREAYDELAGVGEMEDLLDLVKEKLLEM